MLDANFGDGTLGNSLGVLDGEDLHAAKDGSFTLTLDASEGTPGTDHMQLKPGSTVLVIRDTMVDWTGQNPMSLRVERKGGPVGTPPTGDERATEIARRIAAQASFWNRAVQGLHGVPANVLVPPRAIQGGLPGQVASVGRFALADDQALVITVDPKGSPYLGFELTNDWATSMNYWEHTSSLNNGQVVNNVDGTVTYVLSARDPGVCNWLDPVRHAQGLMFLRWQGLPVGAATPPPPASQVVPFDQLDAVLEFRRGSSRQARTEAPDA